MSSIAGLGPNGFAAKQQQDVIADLQEAFQTAFGPNVNLAANSVNGQLIAIFSEREALLWQLAEAVYYSQYPGGAEGTSVDNILALSNLQRLPASATKTNPTPLTQANGIVLYGLVFYGTAGTAIPAASLISNAANPPLTFATDNAVVIAPAANAVQIVFFSSVATQGSYVLSLMVPSGAVRPTPAIPYNAAAAQSGISWVTAPASGTFVLGVGAQMTPALSFGVTAGQLQTALQALTGLGATTVSGSTASGFTIVWPAQGYNPWLASGTTLTFASAPATGGYALSLGGLVTATLPYNASATQIQAAINALSGYGGVIVTGPSGGPFTILWQTVAPPTVTVSSNSTGSALTIGSTYGLDQPAVIANSSQAAVNSVVDPATNGLCFADIVAVASGNSLQLNFGVGAQPSGAASSAAAAQANVTVSSSSLQAGSSVTNTSVTNSVMGAPAMGIGTATCTATGPNSAAAKSLTTIVTPVSGWTGVVNQLDCLVGANLETDSAALARRLSLLNAQANGPLQAIVAKVAEVANVTAALGFQNLNGAAQQILTFTPAPTTGTFTLVLAGNATGSLPFGVTATQLQAALQALPQYGNVTVVGDTTFGLVIDFNGASGGQAQPLVQVAANGTNATITPYYARPPKSFEIVAQGGADAAIAAAIYATAPAGIPSYGSPVLRTAGSITAGTSQLTVVSTTNLTAGLAVVGFGIQSGTFITAISGTMLTLNLPALGTYSNASYSFVHQIQLYDQSNNPQLVSFSRPVAVPIYIQASLVTDTYVIAGNSASGINPLSQFSPSSVPQIQADLVNIVNATPIGGLLVAQGSNGLVGAFNNVLGVVGYMLTFGTAPNPTNTQNIKFQSTQSPNAQIFNCGIAYA